MFPAEGPPALAAARAEAATWRAVVERSASRRKAVSAERKQLYAFLKSLDKRDVGTIATAFGLSEKAARRKRKVVAALFDEAAHARASAALVRRFTARKDGAGLFRDLAAKSGSFGPYDSYR